MSATAFDLTSRRRLDEELHAADNALLFWARFKRRDTPPNGWYTESNTERFIRGPRSTAPGEVPDYFVKVDNAVAKCTPIQRRVLVVKFIEAPENSKEYQRRRLRMSEGMWDRLLRAARRTVANHLT